MTREKRGLGERLHVLIISNTEGAQSMQGADRDWVNLINAFEPETVRITWAGISDTESLRSHFDERLSLHFIDLQFEPFYELFHKSMYQRRTATMWTRIAGRSFLNLRRPLRLLRAVLREDLPDVVVSNTSVVLVGAAFAFFNRLPHIWCVKEFLDPAVADCRRYAKLIQKFSAAVVVPSKSVGQIFSRGVVVLRDGNHLESIRKSAQAVSREAVLEALNLPQSQLVLAQTGALSWAKGQHITADAVVRLSRAVRKPCSLLFLGLASNKDKQEISKVLGQASDEWQSSVRFIEFRPGDFAYLAAADIVVHPSVLPDPYPNAVREALILGKPVIGSRTGGIPDLLKDGVSGVLIEPDNSAALAMALKKLIDSPDERARLGKEARRFADAELNIKHCQLAFLELLNSVAK